MHATPGTCAVARHPSTTYRPSVARAGAGTRTAAPGGNRAATRAVQAISAAPASAGLNTSPPIRTLVP
ncbi:hypothetical protein GCM10022220_72210 [Actinocatenispora rupis]|uniref:Uncharacterized protein n=1 Tax=Actinocatenispora rupis TaxID=519421 RepID=A0A8J3JH62_9ACTN|nr:hypothetical protein Aru02nite_72060 [Actinocatenispora rupis]